MAAPTATAESTATGAASTGRSSRQLNPAIKAATAARREAGPRTMTPTGPAAAGLGEPNLSQSYEERESDAAEDLDVHDPVTCGEVYRATAAWLPPVPRDS